MLTESQAAAIRDKPATAPTGSEFDDRNANLFRDLPSKAGIRGHHPFGNLATFFAF